MRVSSLPRIQLQKVTVGDRIAEPSRADRESDDVYRGVQECKESWHIALWRCACCRGSCFLCSNKHYECPFAETHLVSGRTVAAGPQEQSRWQEPAFCVFRLEPVWYKFQALARPVSGLICFEVGAQSVHRRKRVSCGGSHVHGMEVIMRTPTADSQEALFPPQSRGSRVGPIQRGSARWSCSAKRQATCYKRPFEHNFASCTHLRAQVDIAEPSLTDGSRR